MSETTFEYDEIIPVPIEAAWAAMLRTSELDVLAGQPVVERASNADFVCEMALENGKASRTHCTAAYDESSHTVTVTLDSDSKRVNDTIVIRAEEAGGQTHVFVANTIRGGAIINAMLKFVGKGAIIAACKQTVKNIVAIAQGGEATTLSQDEIDALAKERLGELKNRSKKHSDD